MLIDGFIIFSVYFILEAVVTTTIDIDQLFNKITRWTFDTEMHTSVIRLLT